MTRNISFNIEKILMVNKKGKNIEDLNEGL